jgi:ubiquinone/menaquinone biosynthesis C-methylase UbiE
MSKYQFTDTDLAARRLEYLAEVYGPSSRSFIRHFSDRTVGRAIDLGCGTGYTTEMLRDETDAKSTVGLDNSDRFIAICKTRELDEITFYQHDVTRGPFPAGPYEIAYCRFLLSHLPDISGCFEVWGCQLAPNGLLLIEEVETIHTTVGEFEEYLQIVDQLLAHQSAQLYVGPVLDGSVPSATLRKVSSRVQSVSVSVQDAATMFHMNIQSWRQQPYIRESYKEEVIQNLQNRLASLASGGGSGSEIRWGLRQIVLCRD